MVDELAVARDVLARYPLPDAPAVRPLEGGLINRSFLVQVGDERWVLQRLHPIFGAELHEDLEAVTAHLERKGLCTPRLRRTREGALWTLSADQGIWRVMSFVEGRSLERVDGPPTARAAGALVGRFHHALVDLEHAFHFQRAGVHDTAGHLASLRAALAEHPAHPRRPQVERLAGELSASLEALPDLQAAPLPLRIVHGDLKISNLLFRDGAADPEGVCLVDLDTLAHMKLPLELGDAWRSWCNPLGEDVAETRFELSLLEAAWAGYAPETRSWLQAEERELLVCGVLSVALGLSARFAADALRESYFGWDPRRFQSRGEHNWVRALGQAALARSLDGQRSAAERLLVTRS